MNLSLLDENFLHQIFRQETKVLLLSCTPQTNVKHCNFAGISKQHAEISSMKNPKNAASDVTFKYGLPKKYLFENV